MSIVDVIEHSGVSLKRSGDRYAARCPFHKEDTPSFYVYPETDSFFCFSCHAGGGIQTYIRLHPGCKDIKIEQLKYSIDSLKTQLEQKKQPFVSYEKACLTIFGEINHNIRITFTGLKDLRHKITLPTFEVMQEWVCQTLFLQTDLFELECLVDDVMILPKIKTTYEALNSLHVQSIQLRNLVNKAGACLYNIGNKGG